MLVCIFCLHKSTFKWIWENTATACCLFYWWGDTGEKNWTKKKRNDELMHNFMRFHGNSVFRIYFNIIQKQKMKKKCLMGVMKMMLMHDLISVLNKLFLVFFRSSFFIIIIIIIVSAIVFIIIFIVVHIYLHLLTFISDLCLDHSINTVWTMNPII